MKKESSKKGGFEVKLRMTHLFSVGWSEDILSTGKKRLKSFSLTGRMVETSGESQEKGLYEDVESPMEDVRRMKGECQRAYKSEKAF